MEPSSPKEPQPANQPAVFDWVGRLVLVGYTGVDAPENIYETAVSKVQGYSGVYVLQEVTDLGVVVRKLKEEEVLMQPVFIPWHALNEIHRLGGEGDARVPES